jgi:hypothetical protein
LSCGYGYYEIFDNYVRLINGILLDNTDPLKPYPIYDNKDDYNNDTENDFKGLIVYNAQKYYAGFTGADTNSDVYDDTIGFYVIPEYGEATIRRNIEYVQVVTYTFDSNSDPDYDPYQNKILAEINWFINKHKQVVDDVNLRLPDGIYLYGNVDHISKPIYVPENTTYVRRVVVVSLRYCLCG